MKPIRRIPKVDRWRNLLTVRAQPLSSLENHGASADFSTRVVTQWLRGVPAHPRLTRRLDLWELLGVRAAQSAGIFALAVVLLNLSAWEDFAFHLDAVSLDPAGLLFNALF